MKQATNDPSSVPSVSRKKLAQEHLMLTLEQFRAAHQKLERALMLARRHGVSEDDAADASQAVK